MLLWSKETKKDNSLKKKALTTLRKRKNQKRRIDGTSENLQQDETGGEGVGFYTATVLTQGDLNPEPTCQNTCHGKGNGL